MGEHVDWMIRSFAMVTTAITFRIEHIVFQELGFAAETGFLAALYLSIAGNAILAEFLIFMMNKNKNRKHTKTNETKNDIPVYAGVS